MIIQNVYAHSIPTHVILELMNKIRVGVLRGGPSSEYDVSLKTGAAVMSALDERGYDVRDIFIDREGKWNFRGSAKEPCDILCHIDVAFLALHGEYGEDGSVQRLLDQFAIPYTGSRALPSAFAMNKAYTKRAVEKFGIRTPRYRTLDVSTDIREQILGILRDFALPVIVKPARCGSSVGLTLAESEEMLSEGIRKAFEYGRQVLIEEYINGREATCGVIDRFRGEGVYSLLPVEIIPDHSGRLFDYESKYSGKSKEICPGNFTAEESSELQRIARAVHEGMDLSDYSRSDFIISPKGIYFLEVNTLPGLTPESLLPKSLTAVGSSLPDFLEHVVGLARNRQ